VKARSRGFTLIEVTLAVAITAMMASVMAMAFHTGVKTKEIVETDAEHYRMVRAAMNRMMREIGAAYVSDRYDAKRFRDQNDRPTNFIGERDRLLFTSLSHQRLYRDAKESDQAIIEYSVKRTPDPKAGDRDDLIRRVNPAIGEKMDRGGTEDILFEGAKSIEFEYWDSEKKEWDDEWDTRRPERKSILPTRVRITLVAKDEGGKEVRYTTQTRIMLNTEFGRYE
jgi:general secretion pathway protein J